MAFDTNVRIVGAALAIPAVLLAIGAGYERGGLAGLRDLTTDALESVGLHRKAPAGSALPASKPNEAKPSVALAPDEVFWLSIKDSRAPGLFEEFLKKFPNSPRAPDARTKLQALQTAPPPAAQQQPKMPMHGPMMMGRSPGG
jgi:hypothetical protein